MLYLLIRGKATSLLGDGISFRWTVLRGEGTKVFYGLFHLTLLLLVTLASPGIYQGRTTQGVWWTEVSSGVQEQNMETLENTKGAVTKIDLRWREGHAPMPHLWSRPWLLVRLFPIIMTNPSHETFNIFANDYFCCLW